MAAACGAHRSASRCWSSDHRPSGFSFNGHGDVQPLTHADHSAMDEQLDRPFALAHDLADLSQLEVLAELQAHCNPLLRRQVVNGRPDTRSLDAVDDVIIDRTLRIRDGDGAVEARGRFAAAVMVIDGIDRDLIEPGTEGVTRRPVPADRPQGLEEDLRSNVLGGVRVVQSAVDKPVYLPEVVVVYLPKGISVLLRPFDKLILVRTGQSHVLSSERTRPGNARRAWAVTRFTGGISWTELRRSSANAA